LEIGLDLAQWLVKSMHERIPAVIKARDGPTKY